MWFYYFMFVMELFIPAIMIVFGKVFKNGNSAKINGVYGYRTTMSMKNDDTWQFAHKDFSKRWWSLGWIALIFSIVVNVVLFFFLPQSDEVIGNTGLGLMLIQLLFLIVPIFFTEKELKKHFYSDGERRKNFK